MSADLQADNLASLRVIMYHKYPTSARTTFLMQDEAICLPGRLPKLAQLMDNDAPRHSDAQKVVAHPSPLLRHVTEWLALPLESLELDGEFCEKVDVPGGPVTVYLARFDSIDPPFDAAERVGGRFIALTDGRGLPPAELDLLRRAYRVIMED
jgi:hypothetical protein